ncbi:MAG: hypothetical protein L0Z50_37270, partial [Verrucomicrobiales bacterium]|nr:hypothetical protein [Verrucomicrobiales bacterium]
MTEWARRAGQAALFDWVTANALLPAKDTAHEGIARIDRATVPEIGKISANFGSIQMTYDNSNSGLNPLGLDPEVVPFDLDPTFLDVGSTAAIIRPPIQGTTHFEQIYERAYLAVNNALTAFDNANLIKSMLRQENVTEDQLRRNAEDQDREYRNRLIEIFGTPYEGAIGTGKPYPASYKGPDLSLFMYVDVREVSYRTVPAPSATYEARLVAFQNDFAGLDADLKDKFQDRFQRIVDDVDANLVSWTSVQLTDSSVVQLELPATAQSYTFQAPAEWGTRAAPGRLQGIISDMVQTEADLAFAVGNYDALVNQIESAAALLSARNGVATETIRIKGDQRDEFYDVNAVISTLKAVAGALRGTYEYSADISDAIAESGPRVSGVANDLTFVGRMIAYIGHSAVGLIAQPLAFASD